MKKLILILLVLGLCFGCSNWNGMIKANQIMGLASADFQKSYRFNFDMGRAFQSGILVGGLGYPLPEKSGRFDQNHLEYLSKVYPNNVLYPDNQRMIEEFNKAFELGYSVGKKYFNDTKANK
jgi:hypothetical protein